MDKEKAFAILSKKIDEWEQKPKSDGYERFAVATWKWISDYYPDAVQILDRGDGPLFSCF